MMDEDQRPQCEFCLGSGFESIYEAAHVWAAWDKHPVSPGHALVVCRRHAADWFAATREERRELMDAIEPVRDLIEERYSPHGFNIGLNIGRAAGQTDEHLHLHIIPRYTGDLPDPRGGIRHVLAERGNILADAAAEGAPHSSPLIRGAQEDPLLPHLVAHLSTATHVDIAVAFILTSGVKLLVEHLRDVVKRGGRVRVLTGDYLEVTEPEALRRLLDIGEGLDLRVFESNGESFHLKSYICRRDSGTGTAFVGSSNMSKTALTSGFEWNYRLLTSRDGAAFRTVGAAFEDLFKNERCIPVTDAWISQYETRRRSDGQDAQPAAASGVAPEPVVPVPTPNSVQVEALSALEATRRDGNEAGLVVLATGLGKTWLAAFDTIRARAARVLFVAHREEILDQAMRTFRAIRPAASLGKYTGTERDRSADCVFASIQTLGRRLHLNRFSPDEFDYIVVDEFHHASARTYKNLLSHFTPRFLLGLTATPERTDGADLLALCGENLVYRCDLVEGIRRGLLSPFDYFGVPDEVDYEQIPWRNARFDEKALDAAVAVKSRADNALEQLRRRGGTKTLGFCVSQRHADFMKLHFGEAGLRVAAVHSGPSSDPRSLSLERLKSGDIDVLFAVDMFNEGVDLPDVDTVLMLRPTESPILFLQQLGRGLRWREGKKLKVVDYIGNHRSFLIKPRTLFQLDEGDSSILAALQLLEDGREAELLPPGCSVTYELETKNILRQLASTTKEALQEFYLDFRDRTGARPTASEVFHANLNPLAARRSHGSWLQLVRAMEDLSAEQKEAEAAIRSFLQMLESTKLTRGYKMVLLAAMLDERQLPGSISIEQLTTRVAQRARRSAILREEFGEALENPAALRQHLESNAIPAWVGGADSGQRVFTYADSTFTCTLWIDGSLRDAASELIGELVEWRISAYLSRVGQMSGADRIVCSVSHTQGRPILFLPKPTSVDSNPVGWVDVEANGEAFQAKFAKIAVNVLQKAGEETNVLGDVLRGWFGPSAGQPGTKQLVEFVRNGSGYRLAPVQATSLSGPDLWRAYKRAEVPEMFNVVFRGFDAQTGVVERPGLMLLFVTLNKSGQPKEHQYKDEFLSPSDFQWQSQNRTQRASDAGARIRDHVARGISVHLFVRPVASVRGKTQEFTYCGQLTFVDWHGDRPITVRWKLVSEVPEHLRRTLQVP